MAEISAQTPWRRYYKTVTIPAPAAGVDWRAVVPASESWQLISIYSSLVASATVASRFPELTVTDGNATYLQMMAQAAVTAGQAVRFAFIPNVNYNSLNGLRINPLPLTVLDPSNTIGFVTANIDAGDQWGVTYLRVLATTDRPGPIDLSVVPAMTVIIANPTE